MRPQTGHLVTGLSAILWFVRADRLVAILLLLQTRGRVTASEVAGELEISERTARRDLDALTVAGLPVYSQQGRGGGWSLLGGARTDLSGLNAAEARALFLVAGPSSAATPELRAALRKLVRALPEPFRDAAEAAATRVVIDPAGWGRAAIAPDPPHLAALQQAVVDGVQVRLGYGDRTGAATDRVAHPLGLVAKDNTWYLVADTTAGLRTFRVNRVRSVEPTGEPVTRPDGFDLSREWERIAAEVDERRSSLRCRALIVPRLVPVVRAQLGRQFRVLGDAADGRVEVEFGATNLGMLASKLAGFGSGVEVLDPPEVREHLTRIGADLCALYANASAAGDQQRPSPSLSS